MSAEGMQFIIGRAVTNPAFRDQLRADPVAVATAIGSTQNYAFDHEELDALKAMDWDGLDGVAHDLDQRISRVRIASLHLSADEEETCGCVNTGDKKCPEK